MHDLRDLDERGIPGCFVVTTEFEQAARSQSRTLGFEPGIVWVPHPIQNRTAGELEALADEAIDPILAMITAPD
ncbi:MAG: hypothetical protein F4Z72_09645 [Gemmatimonadales bacterium]|nr:hypothetical protein [Candidatus Palauibacter irciniicola]MYC19296.1 hypothetical protein [Gemmatimonadales bacterium]